MSRQVIDNEADWLKARGQGIGGSDAATVLQISPWKSIDRLYDEKTGIAKAPDISQKPQVIFGHMAEAPIRDLAMLDLGGRYSCHYRQYDILHLDRKPYISATLDGELTDLSTGERGVLEVKTGSFKRLADLEEWNEGVPSHYFAQGIHQLLVGDGVFRFVLFVARVKRDPFGEREFPDIRNYYRIIRYEDVLDDIRYLEEVETKFWEENVLKRVRPTTTIQFR